MTNLTKPTPRPVDTRSELQRAADAVAAAYTFPTSAWSREAVAIRRLLDVVRAHSCPVPAVTEVAGSVLRALAERKAGT